MVNTIFLFIAMLIKVIAMLVMFTTNSDEMGYAIRCVVSGIFTGDAVMHLIPCSPLYVGTQSDIMFYLLFSCLFAFHMINNYKLWKNAK